jgi:hypothetical protein
LQVEVNIGGFLFSYSIPYRFVATCTCRAVTATKLKRPELIMGGNQVKTKVGSIDLFTVVDINKALIVSGASTETPV